MSKVFFRVMSRSFIVVVLLLGVSIAFLSTGCSRSSAPKESTFTDEQRLQLLQDRFLKGEISEKAYYEIKAQLEKKLGKPGEEPKVGKAREEARVSEVKPIPTVAVAGNLLKNGSFEEDNDADGMPDGWEKWGNKVTYLMDDEEKHSGNYSGKLTSVRKISNEGWRQTVTVEPGKKYQFTAWAKGGSDLQYFQGDSGPVVMFSGGGKMTGFIEQGKALKASPVWLKLSKVVTGSPEGKINISMYLYMCSGTVWFDDVVLKPVE